MKISKKELEKIIKEELEKELDESLRTNLAGIATALALFVPTKAKAGILDDLFGEKPAIQQVNKNTAAVVNIKIKPIKSLNLRDKVVIGMAKKEAKKQGIVYKTIMAPKEVAGSNGTEYTVEFIK